jgi:hypothetical protein
VRKVVRPPAEFAEVFVSGGYRNVEHLFGRRTSINILFRQMCGGDALIAARREVRRAK